MMLSWGCPIAPAAVNTSAEMLELAAGIALWPCLPHIKIPGVVGLAALRGIRAKLREREKNGNNNTIGDASSARDEVVATTSA